MKVPWLIFLMLIFDMLQISDVYYAEVTGLCGNYDGEPSNDMKGPLGCLYTDSALHTTAWSSPALGCSRLALRAKKRKLEEFQETCDKDVFQPTGLTQQNGKQVITSVLFVSVLSFKTLFHLTFHSYVMQQVVLKHLLI